MDDGPLWIVCKIDGKIASVSLDYTGFAFIARQISRLPAESIAEINCFKVPTAEVVRMAETACWEDLMLFGSDFQKMVWKRLFDLTHRDGAYVQHPELMSYSDFAEVCGNGPGVRAVAHAVAKNPVAVIIPCHLIVPKETMDRIEESRRQADCSLFGRDGLVLDPGLDFGEYRYGRDLKRRLILG